LCKKIGEAPHTIARIVRPKSHPAKDPPRR
jgi:hypothetical protein